MILTRKFGKIFRGKATPAQLMMATLIGTTAGFMPGFAQAPGLVAVLFLAALVLNANLAVIGLSLLLGKLLSLALLPVSFAVGRFLIDGPLEGLFTVLINAPVLALFGFEYYATVGGLVLGLLIGAALGFSLNFAVRSFRRKMAALEKSEGAWTKFCAHPAVRIFTLIFIGGNRGKASYEELLAKSGGSPLRPLGLAAAGLALVAGTFVTLLASDSIVAYAVQSGLEKANGATVDMEGAELRLREGKVMISGLAIADPKKLNTDLFRAETIEADIHQADLLRKRVHIERLRVSDASSGQERKRPGILVRPLPELPPESRESGEKTVDDYLKEAEKWKDRLVQVADWLERFGGGESGGDGPAVAEDDAARERRLHEEGYRHAAATHLIRGAPTLLVSEMTVEKMRTAHLPDETLEIVAENFSTHPSLVEKSPRFSIRSSGETLQVDALLAGYAMNPADNRIALAYLNLPVDRIAGGLKLGDQPPLQGGMIDLRGNGSWQKGQLDLPLEVTLRGSRLALAQVGETDVEQLVLPIGVAGPFRNPRIHFADGALADALAAAGKAEMARRVQGETDKLRNKAEERVGSELRERTRGLFERR